MSARLDPVEVGLRQIRERDWQSTVEGIARRSGWLLFHAPDNLPVTSKRGTKYIQNIKSGFPDLVLVRGSRIVFAELKRQGPAGRLTADQQEWLTALEQVQAATSCVEVCLWRPGDLRHVLEVLR